MAEDAHDITRLLLRWGQGDREALAELMPLVYAELRRLAQAYLSRERPDHTLQPTALVHEAFLRLSRDGTLTFQGRRHFFGVAAQVMRHILVNHARDRQRQKRGGGATRVALDEAMAAFAAKDLDVLALDRALERLESRSERQGRVVELRFFGGLSLEETAETLDVSIATVKRDWTVARAFLHRELRAST